jgi:hypothetical protein
VKSYAIHHINYNADMDARGLLGVFYIDKETAIYLNVYPSEEVESMTLYLRCIVHHHNVG